MFTVSLIRADGYVFNYAAITIEDARKLAAQAAAVLLPGERIELTAE